MNLTRYLEAVESERLNRDAAFIPITEDIAGFEVLPMTLRHYLMLRVMKSPLLSGRLPNVTELGAFLWVLSPRYTAGKSFWRIIFFRKFRTCSPSNSCSRFVAVVAAARQYVHEALQDQPASSGKDEKSYFSDVAGLCATFGREFGWDDEVTLSKPMKRILQYLKEMIHRAGSKTPQFNPSDSILNEELIALNKEKQT